MSRYDNIRIVLIAPPELRLPSYIKSEVCDRCGMDYREVDDMESVMPELDVLYMTRVQKERFVDEEEFERVKDCFVLDARKMSMAKSDMAVLHPLPRVNEILQEVDDDPRAAYFRQVENGKFVRMALMMLRLLEWAEKGFARRASRSRAIDRTYMFESSLHYQYRACRAAVPCLADRA